MKFNFEKMFGFVDPVDEVSMNPVEEMTKAQSVAKTEREAISNLQRAINELNATINSLKERLATEHKSLSKEQQEEIEGRIEFLFGERERLSSLLLDKTFEAEEAEEYVAKVHTEVDKIRNKIFTDKLERDLPLQ